jgi:hypothetical protein
MPENYLGQLLKRKFDIRHGLICFCLSLPFYLFIIASAGAAESGQSEVGDTVQSELQLIDSVKIVTEDVFDLTQPQYDNILFRLANSVHVVTRPSVIRRELLLDKGDYFDTATVNESIRNLRRLPYLLKTDILMEKGRNGENIMVVNTSDKWTTVTGLSFNRTGGRTDIQMTLEENNLLGYGVFISGDYWIVEDDRDFSQFEIADSRFWGGNFSVDFFYSDNPRAGQSSILLGRPFYNLNQKWGGDIRFTQLRRRFDYYTSEQLSARERTLSDKLQVKISHRIGPSYIKYHITSEYRYTDLESLGQTIYDSSIVAFLPPPSQDSLINYFQITARVEQINYAVFKRLNRFHKPEDINLGLDSRIAYGRAFHAGLDGTMYQFFSLWPQYSLAFKSNRVSKLIL